MFQLDLTSKKSIYEQIVDGIKSVIISGEVPAGGRLPSVRDLSAALTVNPNTIQKAIKKLEQDGWIYTVSGRGCFVSEAQRIPDEEQCKRILNEIGNLIDELYYTGVNSDYIKSSLLTLIDKKSVNR